MRMRRRQGADAAERPSLAVLCVPFLRNATKTASHSADCTDCRMVTGGTSVTSHVRRPKPPMLQTWVTDDRVGTRTVSNARCSNLASRPPSTSRFTRKWAKGDPTSTGGSAPSADRAFRVGFTPT